MSLTKITDSVVETFSRWFRVNNTTGAITSVIPDLSGSNTTLYPSYMCRAWVNFNGTGTISIRASGNVSTLVDDNSGRYRINFTNPMPDINYSTICTAGSNTQVLGVMAESPVTVDPTVSQTRIAVIDHTGNIIDAPYISVAVFR